MNSSPETLMQIDADLKLIERGLEQIECDPADTLAAAEAWQALTRIQTILSDALLAATGDGENADPGRRQNGTALNFDEKS